MPATIAVAAEKVKAPRRKPRSPVSWRIV